MVGILVRSKVRATSDSARDRYRSEGTGEGASAIGRGSQCTKSGLTAWPQWVLPAGV